MRLQRLLIWLSALTLTAALGAGLSPQPGGGAIPVAAIAPQWAALWSAKQLEPILALYTQDAVFLTGTGDRITGKPAIRAAFKGGMDASTARLTVMSVAAGSSGDLAYDSGDYRETTTLKTGATREDRGSYLIVFKRQSDGAWLIAQHVWTAAPPASR